jgi:hypothetical protein
MPSSDYTPLLYTVTGSTATSINIDLSSIQNYTDLVMYILPYVETGDNNGLRITFNNNTSAIYNTVYNFGKNADAAPVGYDSTEENGANSTPNAWMVSPGTTGTSMQTVFYFEFPSYSNTNVHKQLLMKSRKSYATSEFNTARFGSTSAITSMQIATSGGAGNRIVAGTKIVIWGLKAAG